MDAESALIINQRVSLLLQMCRTDVGGVRMVQQSDREMGSRARVVMQRGALMLRHIKVSGGCYNIQSLNSHRQITTGTMKSLALVLGKSNMFM